MLNRKTGDCSLAVIGAVILAIATFIALDDDIDAQLPTVTVTVPAYKPDGIPGKTVYRRTRQSSEMCEGESINSVGVPSYTLVPCIEVPFGHTIIEPKEGK